MDSSDDAPVLGSTCALRTGGASAQANVALSRPVLLLIAIASGLAVANVYYAQPLLDAIGDEFAVPRSNLGIIGTLTQVGYGVGLLFIVPLGDLVDRRRLILGQTLLSALALWGVAAANDQAQLLACIFLLGSLSVVAQVHVAHAAGLARSTEKGQVVGVVTSGIICGILLARAVSGALSDGFGWRTAFAVAACANLGVAALLAKSLPRQSLPGASVGYGELVVSVLTLLKEERVLRVRGMLALLIFMSITVLWTSVGLALRAEPHRLSHTAVGLFGLAGVVGALGAAYAGRRADQGGAQRTTGLALMLMALAWLPVAALPYSLTALTVGIVLLDFGLQAVHVSNQSLVYRGRPDAQSRLTGAYMLFYSSGCAIGAGLSTWAYDRAGWLGAAALGLASSALSLVFFLATRDESTARSAAG